MSNQVKDLNINAPSQENFDEVMKKYDRESNVRIWTGKPAIAVKAILIGFSLFCIWVTLFATFLEEIRLTSFMGLIVLLGFLYYPANKNNNKENHIPWYDILGMILGTGAFLYYTFNAEQIIQQGTRFQPYQIVIAVIGIIALLEVTRRSVGWPILIVALFFIVYALVYGLTNPSALGRLNYLVRNLFYAKTGILSTPINVCSKYIVVFIIFGAFLERTGISELFINLANCIAGRFAGGPAKVAVISSALCGMVSGSSVGNTVTTGSVTIPMMKETGYKSSFAGAVEAAASTGGQIMPPIMGAAAFLMADIIGVPYSDILSRAIFPAVLYFTGIFVAVHLEAKKHGLTGVPVEKLPKFSQLLKKIYLLAPLVLLVIWVSKNMMTMQRAAAYSIVVAILVGVIEGFVSGDRFTLKKFLESLEAGGRGTITVGAACGVAGIISGTITMTGLANEMINAIVAVAGDKLFIALFLTMLCCIVLGMGVPTTATYCIMAATCAPILTRMGVPIIAAHFFVFYFGIVADITPPVALAAYAGSAIAKSNPMRTAIAATKMAVAAFLIPYIFCFSPAMLLIDTTVSSVIIIYATALIGIMAVAAALEGYLFTDMKIWERIIMIVGGIMLISPGTITDAAGVAVIAVALILQFISKKRIANA
ncbi:TRAP transporter permease [Butyrivibrio sp. INlla21]|uniref:TRAP transporter permease n=1 Tax=Butyrivibrio sp. INlla21 TaxID=1520811 RepID=UPI0008F22FB1|nr:TRAP transporter permease [Butyrivibrio sp. INlla21]SFU98326.1 TRAP transporter, 4TM/12TM fusion protein [Butyrivibrio sp. INlla21]